MKSHYEITTLAIEVLVTRNRWFWDVYSWHPTLRTQFIPFYQQLAFNFLIWLNVLPVHCAHWGLNNQTDRTFQSLENNRVRDHCLSSHHYFSKKLPFKFFQMSNMYMIYQKLSWLDVQTCSLSWTCLQYHFFTFYLCFTYSLTLLLCNSHPSNVPQVKLPVLWC